MEKLLIASHNQGKIKEFKRLLVDWPFEIVSLDDVGIAENVEETGKTFEENAQIKAEFYGKLSRIPTIADDGGLLINVLNGEPGVKSKRWMEKDATDNELINYTLKRLSNIPSQKRIAYLQTSLCYYNPINRKTILEGGKIRGVIAQKQSNKPTHGYPFRALFVVSKINKYYDELTEEEHRLISHRLKALRRLVNKIKSDLIK